MAELSFADSREKKARKNCHFANGGGGCTVKTVVKVGTRIFEARQSRIFIVEKPTSEAVAKLSKTVGQKHAGLREAQPADPISWRRRRREF